MNTILEIETAIAKLPEQDAHLILIWLQNRLESAWDNKITEDVASGRLSNLIDRAESDIAANRVGNLNEIFDNA